MHVKRSDLENYIFPYQQTKNKFYPDFSRLLNNQTFSIDFVGTCIPDW